jgi:hypothetical protein
VALPDDFTLIEPSTVVHANRRSFSMPAAASVSVALPTGKTLFGFSGSLHSV